MNGQIDFDCREFLDNTNLAILEISLSENDGDMKHRINLTFRVVI
ncbi:MAG TPA: hypothetical protein VKB19_13920 [Pedobacter sp.]|nr:hypothetical protein [Pedobacter sp.]